MCFFKKKKIKLEPIEGLPLISRASYVEIAHKSNILPFELLKPLDSYYSVANKAQLDSIASSLVFPADEYISQLADCEDYGLRAQVTACFTFHVSSARLCLGQMPLGYHGFVIAIDNYNNLYLLEPNAGFEYAGQWFSIGEHGYLPDRILI